MLYPESTVPRLNNQTFKNPGAEYRGAPFWAWNTTITPQLVTSQIDSFKQMGFGGYHIHPRTGMATKYMGREYLELVKLADEHGKQQGMLTWLYDEDRFPSGAAGGLVTEDVQYRSRHMLLSLDGARAGFCAAKEEFLDLWARGEKCKGYYLTSYEVVLEEGFLVTYRQVPRDAVSDAGHIWHGYIELMEESPWFNGQTYIDAMNKQAVEQFIRLTHEAYYRELGGEFGKSIPAIFTDEPHVKGRQTHPFADSTGDIMVTYTDDFSDTFRQAHGYEILDVVPELLWQLPQGRVSPHRWRFHDHVCERFTTAFADTLGEWCGRHGVALTGHLLSERTLFSQTLALGEAMRVYRGFQLPGIDILADQKEFSTAKQAASVARQYGREGVTSELYGVTHWDFDFKGHKLQGDWQAALGVTIRVPHLAFMSMEGEAKRDWPASIAYQSPWYEKYTLVEDHFARLNTALTRGRPHCRVGIIHPIESYWLYFGPNDQTQPTRDQLDENFENLMQWLLYGLVDFDLISESLLPTQCPRPSAPLQVGEMAYDTIIVPDCRTLRGSTLERLEAFSKAGGRLVFAGTVPFLENAEPSGRALSLAESCTQVPYDREGLLVAVEPVRELSVYSANGKPADNLFHQFRQDGTTRWLFLCHVRRRRNHVLGPESYVVELKGEWALTLYDTANGEIRPLPAKTGEGVTRLSLELYAEDSILLHLQPAISDGKDITTAPIVRIKPAPPTGHPIVFHQPESYRLSEPNALLLDYARGAIDGDEFGPLTEILKLDNDIRGSLGYARRQDAFIQPWKLRDEFTVHRVRLEYRFNSSVAADGCFLAIERPQETQIILNGKRATGDAGYYVDSFIRLVPLSTVTRGENRLVLEMPFTKKSNLENLYILGDFGVELFERPRIVSRPLNLAYGDITRQGLPFYTGNVLYDNTFTLSKPGPISVVVPHFAAPVLEVWVNGISRGTIAYAPHRLDIPKLEAGSHTLTLCAYGNRFNGFGTLHNYNDEFMWYGPDSYRTTGEEWSDNYSVRQAGILSRVELYTQE